MCLDMLLEVLRALEGLATEITFVRLQRNVDSNMRGDVITLDCRGATVSPRASQIEVISALAPDMAFANVFLLPEMVRGLN